MDEKIAISHDSDIHYPVYVRIKNGYEGGEAIYKRIGPAIKVGDQWWTPIERHGEPEFFKTECLEDILEKDGDDVEYVLKWLEERVKKMKTQGGDQLRIKNAINYFRSLETLRFSSIVSNLKYRNPKEAGDIYEIEFNNKSYREIRKG